MKFLKEEPHRLDALLKRCKTITDTLATMRKYETTLILTNTSTFGGCRLTVKFRANINENVKKCLPTPHPLQISVVCFVNSV